MSKGRYTNQKGETVLTEDGHPVAILIWDGNEYVTENIYDEDES